jgi:hypothetical protein
MKLLLLSTGKFNGTFLVGAADWIQGGETGTFYFVNHLPA